MAGETEALATCVNLVMDLARMEQKISISIKIGQDFHFDFCNQEKEVLFQKRITPSRFRRNENRKIIYDQHKALKEAFKHESCDPSLASDSRASVDKETQCKFEHTVDISSQTSVVSVLDACVNTDKELFETVNDMVGVNSNGEIHPKDGEVLIEMAVSHEFKSWDEIKNHVRSNLKMKILGVPWLANSGRQFKTVGFRTWIQDFETWKRDTFNWQASGIRGVTTSRVFK